MDISVNDKFGQWTVIEVVDKRHVLCECSCSDKTRKVIEVDELRKGRSIRCKKCSCRQSVETRTKNKEQENVSMIGNKYGRRTVLDYDTTSKKFLTECSCANKTRQWVTKYSLFHAQSCGCYGKEVSSKRMVEYNLNPNDYDLTGDYGIGYTHKGEPFYFDLEDYDKICNISWSINPDGYIVGHNPDTKKNVFLHCFIMGLPKNCFVDHIGGKPTRNDCRKGNLRLATREENAHNQDLHSNNTSGVTGVYWLKREQRWSAEIYINGKKKNLGRFKEFDDAVKKRKEAEEIYFGEFSRPNSVTHYNQLSSSNLKADDHDDIISMS